MSFFRYTIAATLLTGSALLAAASPASAQNSSIYVARQPGAMPGGVPGGAMGRGPLMLSEVSPIYQTLPPPREVKVHDLVTIRVDEKSQTFAEGSIERRKNSSFDAMLQDWVILEGLTQVRTAPQTSGDQRLRGQANTIYRAESDLETRESLKFDITAEVVDIRPNGTLVLEAHRVLENNDERWEYSLSGLVRKDDIMDGNLILSKSIAELRVNKREHGSVRDGYQRGWLLRFWDQFRWF